MQKTSPGAPWLLAATLPLCVFSLPTMAQDEGWSTARSLSPARTLGVAASAGGKALFGGGGHPWTGYRNEV